MFGTQGAAVQPDFLNLSKTRYRSFRYRAEFEDGTFSETNYSIDRWGGCALTDHTASLSNAEYASIAYRPDIPFTRTTDEISVTDLVIYRSFRADAHGQNVRGTSKTTLLDGVSIQADYDEALIRLGSLNLWPTKAEGQSARGRPDLEFPYRSYDLRQFNAFPLGLNMVGEFIPFQQKIYLPPAFGRILYNGGLISPFPNYVRDIPSPENSPHIAICPFIQVELVKLRHGVASASRWHTFDEIVTLDAAYQKALTEILCESAVPIPGGIVLPPAFDKARATTLFGATSVRTFPGHIWPTPPYPRSLTPSCRPDLR